MSVCLEDNNTMGESIYCLVCTKEYFPHYVDTQLAKGYFATFNACMDLKLEKSWEKVQFQNFSFPFCEQCTVLIANVHAVRYHIESLEKKVLQTTLKLTALILETHELNENNKFGKHFESAVVRIREKVVNRYQVLVKVEEYEKRADPQPEFCCENSESIVPTFLLDEQARYENPFYEKFSEYVDEPVGRNQRKPKTLVKKVADDRYMYDNEFLFVAIGDDFQCHSCQYKSKSKYTMVQHIRLTHSEPIKAFSCESCGKTFKNSKTLKIHSNTHVVSPTPKLFPCNLCGKEFKYASSMYFHQICNHDNVNSKRHTCPECGKLFFKKASLDLHVVCHSKETRFQCLHCGRKFARRNAWRVHNITMKSRGSILCELCRALFTHRCALLSHKKVVHNAIQLMGKSHRDIATSRLSKDHGKTDVVADIGKVSSRKYTKESDSSTRFRINQTNNKILLVGVDTFLYGNKFKFMKQDEEYQCLTCSYRSAKKFNILSHIRVTHLYTDDFICECCGKSYKQPSELRKHQKIHVTESIYMCEECGSKFKTMDGLRSHKRVHSSKITRGFECQICNKIYQYKKTLREHLIQHENQQEKLFECSECHKRFCSKRSRNFHVKCHTTKDSEKQFSCQQCQVNFTHSFGLKRHVKIYHKSPASSVMNQ